MKARVVGDGMVAKAMADLPFDVTIFASGVSDSGCCSEDQFSRERDLLTCTRAEKLVYFSTITVRQKHPTPYIIHKKQMEDIVRSTKHLIVRLPNLIGPNQSKQQLVPALVEQVLSGRVEIQIGAIRDILDVKDLRRRITEFLRNGITGTQDILTGCCISVDDLVSCLSEILGENPEREYVPPLDYPTLNGTFDRDYYRHVLESWIGRK